MKKIIILLIVISISLTLKSYEGNLGSLNESDSYTIQNVGSGTAYACVTCESDMDVRLRIQNTDALHYSEITSNVGGWGEIEYCEFTEYCYRQ
jgi:hypothetical protein